jgi:outer membrane protein OmpA-like peptidoglycan-associated protein
MVKQKFRVFAVFALSLAILTAGAFVLPGVSVAAEKGIYIEGRAGAVFADDSKFDTTTQQDAEHDIGWGTGLGLGYAYGNGVRGELGLDYRQSDIDKVGGVGASGTARAGSLMISGYYDFFRDSIVQPYLGAGFGLGLVDADSISPVSGSSVNDDDFDLAYQGMAGIAFNISSRTKVSLGYRYFYIPDLKFRTAGGASVDSDYASHEVMLGVRFSFGAPTPKPKPKPAAPPPLPQMEPMMEPEPEPEPPKAAAPPAPTPQPEPEISRNFLVFFDWNRATITALAENIIQSAVAETKRVDTVRLRLTGHADRSGTSRYNQRLSMERAEAVRGRLVQLGVGASDIAVFAKGESEPLVTTGDGVREPQNRRVEIILE